MEHRKDDRGYNQVWADTKATRIRSERRCNAIIAEMQIGPSKSVMEIGCGVGKNAFMLAEKTGMNVLGTDLCVPFIDEARETFKLPNLRYDILDFNYPDRFKGERFDYIIGNGILHHLYHNLDAAFGHMLDLLKDNGKLIFWEPNIYNPYIYLIFTNQWLRKKTFLEPDEMAFSKRFVSRKLQEAGYKDVHADCRDFVLPGIPDSIILPAIMISDILDKTPVMRNLAQSLFITAVKG
jgi:cyclopropane fatty-acyl-phospholipid synthase-like methyltransferase